MWLCRTHHRAVHALKTRLRGRRGLGTSCTPRRACGRSFSSVNDSEQEEEQPDYKRVTASWSGQDQRKSRKSVWQAPLQGLGLAASSGGVGGRSGASAPGSRLQAPGERRLAWGLSSAASEDVGTCAVCRLTLGQPPRAYAKVRHVADDLDH